MNPDLPTPPPPDPEARLTALLLGELSPEEAAEVHRSLAANPEQARLLARLAQTIGFVREALPQPASPAAAPSPQPQLAPNLRQALLAKLQTLTAPAFATRPPRRRQRTSWFALAAAACLLLLLGAGMLLPSLAKAKAKGKSVYAAQSRIIERLGAAEESPAIVNGVSEPAPAAGRFARDLAARPESRAPRTVAFDAAPPAGQPTSPGSSGAPSPALDIRMMMRYGLLPKGLKLAEAETATSSPAAPPPPPLTAPSASSERRVATAANPLQEWFHIAQTPDVPSAESLVVAGDFVSSLAGEPAAGLVLAGPSTPGHPGQDLYRNAGQVTFYADSPHGGASVAPGEQVAGGLGGGLGGLGGFGGGAFTSAAPGGAAPLPEPVVQPSSLPRSPRMAAEAKGPSPELAGLIESTLAPAEAADRLDGSSRASRPSITRGHAVVTNLAQPTPGQTWGDYDGDGLLDLAVPRDRGRALSPTASPSTPVLGDAPQLGRQLRSELARDPDPLGLLRSEAESLARSPAPARSLGLALGAEVRLQPGAAALQDLEPLPLQLPIPAFMGTPTDIPLGTPAPRPTATLGFVPAQPEPPASQPQPAPPADTADTLSFGQALAQTDHKERYAESASKKGVEGVTLADDAVREDRQSAERGLQELPELAQQLEERVRPVTPAAPARPTVLFPPEVPAAENPFSTFSLNVADVSFKLAAASLEAGQWPDPASIRVEEFVNAFNYRDPEPAPDTPIGFHWERARHPFAHNRDVLRFSVQTAALGREPGRPLNLVLLLDNSGSMERADRVAIIREALRVLAGQLEPQDQISVVAFARTARLWVDALSGSQAAELLDRVGHLAPEGGTNLEDALRVGYETALRHFLSDGINRVILLTDGAANLGAVEPDLLQSLVEDHRRRGVALDCFGIGWEGYNDDLLEVLSRHGDGRYGFVNTPEEAAAGFADQLAGALRVAAADVKVQIEFNPARVRHWRQIGYAKHQLTQEQFRDNTVDAAEIGAAESGNALYAIEVNPAGQGPLGTFRVRYRVPATGQYREHEWSLDYAGPPIPLLAASPALRLAVVAAAFGEQLAGSPFASEVQTDQLIALLADVPRVFQPDPRPYQLETMLQQARSLSGR